MSTQVMSGATERRWLSTLLVTERRWVPTALRTTLGLVMLPHGAQKTLGWFGGFGFAQTLRFFIDVLHVSAPLALLVILIESLGSVALLLGFYTRVAAAGIVALMMGAVARVHLDNGFFMNWSGNQRGEGFEYHLLAIAIGVVLVVVGGGRVSYDAKVSLAQSPQA